MRPLVITQNITIDGAIEMIGDWFDPSADDQEQLAEVREQSRRSDALLVGRQTFEDLRGYWPIQADDRTGITDELNQIQKYVVSSTMVEPKWQNSTILSGDWLGQVRELKQQDGGVIGVTGSITLCHALIEAGLVDEYSLYVYPVVQGKGRRLFPDGVEIPKLRLIASKSFSSGVALLRYVRA